MRIADRARTVLGTAPNFVPDSLFRTLGTVRRDSTAPMKLIRGMVEVSFKDGVAQRERQQAIDLIDGLVVGRIRIAGDGQYFVRIPGSTYADIQDARSKLEALPQVESPVAVYSTRAKYPRRPVQYKPPSSVL